MSHTSLNFEAILWIIAAYLLGSIAFGLVMSKLYKLPDPRTVGSGNIGATNIARSGKKSAAILTLLGDMLKGWLIVWLAIQLNGTDGVIAAVGLSVFFGHLFPLYHRFKGGKGVATALGVMLAFSGYLALLALLAWTSVFFITRISSLAALVSSLLMPILAWWLLADHPMNLAVIITMSAFLIIRHQSNIEKLLAGNEAKFKK